MKQVNVSCICNIQTRFGAFYASLVLSDDDCKALHLPQGTEYKGAAMTVQEAISRAKGLMCWDFGRKSIYDLNKEEFTPIVTITSVNDCGVKRSAMEYYLLAYRAKGGNLPVDTYFHG